MTTDNSQEFSVSGSDVDDTAYRMVEEAAEAKKQRENSEHQLMLDEKDKELLNKKSSNTSNGSSIVTPGAHPSTASSRGSEIKKIDSSMKDIKHEISDAFLNVKDMFQGLTQTIANLQDDSSKRHYGRLFRTQETRLS